MYRIQTASVEFKLTLRLQPTNGRGSISHAFPVRFVPRSFRTGALQQGGGGGWMTSSCTILYGDADTVGVVIVQLFTVYGSRLHTHTHTITCSVFLVHCASRGRSIAFSQSQLPLACVIWWIFYAYSAGHRVGSVSSSFAPLGITMYDVK